MDLDFNLLNKNKKYIIAVSGGSDSMFLLDNIYNNIIFNNKNFYVCFVNYKKRKDSKIDQKIVLNYCKKRKIKIFILKVNKKIYLKYKKYSNNFQSIARDIRYDFFLKIFFKKKCDSVLIAHNLTDNIETYLLQKKRKNIVEYYGLNKISFYYSKIFNKKIKILRIMLDINKKFILKYLNLNKLIYANDYTNFLLIYERNRLRYKINNNFNIINFILILIWVENLLNYFLKKKVNIFLNNNNNNINLISFNKINNLNLKKMILYKYFKINNYLNLLINKKNNFLFEVIKQLNSKKPNILIKINNFFCFLKTFDIIKIINFDIFNLETNIINYRKKKFNWKKISFSFSLSKKQNFIFNCYKNQFPLIITNNYSKFNKIKYNNKIINFNKLFIKEKINILDRLGFVILDKEYNLVFLNKILYKKLKKYFFKKLKINEKQKYVYFMIK